jgi:hypothetical protein
MKPGLAAQTRAALAAARKEARVVRRRASFSGRERSHEVELEVIPLKTAQEGDRHFLILIHEISAAPGAGTEVRLPSVKAGARGRWEAQEIETLQQELNATRQCIQSPRAIGGWLKYSICR